MLPLCSHVCVPLQQVDVRLHTQVGVCLQQVDVSLQQKDVSLQQKDVRLHTQVGVHPNRLREAGEEGGVEEGG